MIFYKVVGRLNNPEPDDNYPGKYKMIRNYAYSCRERFESFYQKYDKQLYCFISEIKSDKVVIGCILQDKNMIDIVFCVGGIYFNAVDIYLKISHMYLTLMETGNHAFLPEVPLHNHLQETNTW